MAGPWEWTRQIFERLKAKPETHRVSHSVHLNPDSPMTGGIVSRGPKFEVFATPSLAAEGGGGAPTRVTIEVTRGGSAESVSYDYIAVSLQQHAEGASGVIADGVWYGSPRDQLQDAASDAAGHEHPGHAVVHALLSNGVSIGPVAS